MYDRMRSLARSPTGSRRWRGPIKGGQASFRLTNDTGALWLDAPIEFKKG